MRNLRFIECVRNDGERILINIDNIETIFPLDEKQYTEKTRICFSNGYVDVNDTYERIIQMIEYCEAN